MLFLFNGKSLIVLWWNWSTKLETFYSMKLVFGFMYIRKRGKKSLSPLELLVLFYGKNIYHVVGRNWHTWILMIALLVGDCEIKAILVSLRKNEFVGREETHVPHHFCCQVSSSKIALTNQNTNDRRKKKRKKRR